MENYQKLKEIVLLLISIILVSFIIKYLGLIKIFSNIIKIFIPVIIGFIYAWLINPLILKLSKNKHRNIVAIIVFLILIFLIGLFLYLLIPTVYKELNELLALIPSLNSMLNKKLKKAGLQNIMHNTSNILMKYIPTSIISCLKCMFKYIGVFGVGLVLGLYISIDYETIVNQFYNLLPHKLKKSTINILNTISNEVHKCVNGTLFVAFLVFVMSTLSFTLLKLEAPLLIGLFCGITDLIPYIGPYIGGAIAVLVGFTESKTLGILALIICIIVQSIENYVLQPIVMSKSIKISPILIIIGLIFFGKIFGICGMILATPFVAIIKVLSETFLQKQK